MFHFFAVSSLETQLMKSFKNEIKFQFTFSQLMKTTNVSFNATLLAMREKPILIMVEWIRTYSQKVFCLKGKGQKMLQGCNAYT